MNTTTFFVHLKNRFSQWPWLLLALRQDALVWEALQDTDLGNLALESLPEQPPADLCLLALDYPAGSDQLRLLPLEPLDALWSGQSAKAFEAWSQTHQAPMTLAQAGLLALAAREHYRQAGAWDKTLEEDGLACDTAKTVLSCLFGMAPDPHEFLVALLQSAPERPRPDLVAHILLSNPMPGQALAEIIQTLLQDVPRDARLVLLHEFSLQRPRLVASLADDLLDEHDPQENYWQEDGRKVPAGDIVAGFERLISVMRQVQIYRLASRPGNAVPLLAEALRTTHFLRGHLSAQLAQTIKMACESGDEGWEEVAQETGLEAWKRAAQLAPDVPAYSAGLAVALASAGRLEEAGVYLQGLEAGAAKKPHASLSLASAQVAVWRGDLEVAQKAACEALTLAKTQPELDLNQFIWLAGFFHHEDMPAECLGAASLGFERYPFSQDLCALMAKAQYDLGHFEHALSNAFTALALESVFPQDPRLLPEPADDNHFQFWSPLSEGDIHRVLIDSLEATSAWEHALEERLGLMQAEETPSLSDLQALAYCALKAGQPEQTLRASRSILEIAPDDLSAHSLLAKAAQELGDYETAVQHYSQITQLAPDNANAWLALANAHRQAGDGAQAVEVLLLASQAAPEEARIHLELGEAYLDQSAPTQALACFRRAAELSNSPLVGLRLGQTLYQLGHLEEACQVLQAAYETWQTYDGEGSRSAGDWKIGDFPELQLTYAYARTLLDLGEYLQAVSLLKDVVLARPDDPLACLDLARGLMQISDRQSGARRAIPLLQRVLCADADQVGEESGLGPPISAELLAEARNLLAEAYTDVGELDLAMESYHLALESPYNQTPERRARLAVGLGRAALRLDQPETAVAALQDAAQDEPLNIEVQRALAEACLAGGLVPQAFEAAEAAFELAPTDLASLNWFVDLGMRLLEQPGSKQLPVLDKVIQALRKGTQQDSQRGDLLLRLGRVLMENDEPEAAQDAFQRLLDIGDTQHYPAASELYQTARMLRLRGDAELAITLLEQATERGLGDEVDTGGSELTSRADLFAEAALAHQQLGDNSAALHALDQALSMDTERVDLYRNKADLLSTSGDYKAALEALKEAARLKPEDGDLHYRMAEILCHLGDLQSALSQVESAISLFDESTSRTIKPSVYLLAAELAYRMLKPHRANTYLEQFSQQAEDDFRNVNHASLQAELALDAGDEATAAQAIMLLREIDPDHPRCRAARARLACLRGNCPEGAEFLKEALKAIGEDGGADQNYSDELLSLLALSQAAMDAAQWEDALALAERTIEASPSEPLPRLRLAQTLVTRAEAQSLCQALDVRFHAAGQSSLLDEARIVFEGAIQALFDITGMEVVGEEEEGLDWSSDEVGQILNLWQARGAAVFQPQPATAMALWEALKRIPVRPDCLAALVMALRRSGDDAGAVTATQPDWHPEAISGSVIGHPLVLAQLALALEKTSLERAIEVATDGSKRAEMLVSGGWPDPAMLKYLQARLNFQFGAYGQAFQSAEMALSEWPQEPRWHFLAAQICMTDEPAAGLPNPLKAQDHLERAVALEPDHAPHYLALGQVRAQAGQTRQAVTALERASILDPESGDIWLALAQSQQDLGDLDRAETSAEQALARGENPIPSLLLSGKIALQNGKPSVALERSQAILQQQPEHAEALYLLARALEALERPEEALVAMDRALPHFEDPFSMQMERVHMLRRAKGLGAALTGLQELATRFDLRPEILALLSDWLEEAGDRQSAVQAAQIALQQDHGELSAPQRAAIHYRIGLNARQSGHLDQAIHHLNRAIEYNSALLDAYLELGQAHQERREYQAALKVYQNAIAVAAGDFRPYYQAGLVLKDNKEYLAAEKMLRRASQLAPNDVGVHRLLGAVMALNLVHNRHMAPPDA